ncbi:MAG: LamG-like jellyroll fold domain-containing protein [Verrucomicrobiales bacterium]
MNRHQRLARVAKLTCDLLDDRLSAAGREELNHLLRGDPEACERYLELAELDAALAYEHAPAGLPIGAGTAIPFPDSTPSIDTRRGSRRRRRVVRNTTIAAAAIVVLLFNGFLLRRNAGMERPDPEPSSLSAVAVLSRAVEPQWPQGSLPLEEGDAVPEGAFRLRSGLAQLEFFSGATVIVEGPAELVLVSDTEIECREGRLRAFVPEPARGFAIETPDYKAVDLGTEFSLSVGSDGRSEVHVADGEVRLDNYEGKELRRLTTGAGIRARSGVFESVLNGGNGFVDRRRFLELANADSETHYRSWQRQRDAFANDPSTLVLFDFENQQPWDRQLANRSVGGPGGAIVGARWTEGRWPGKGALEFKRITDRVRLRVPGSFDALTLAAWVRIEGLDRWLSSLLLTDGFDPGEVHWQISDKGELILGISSGETPNTVSPPVIHPGDLGRWMHVAATLDRKTGAVTHYLDSELVAEETRDSMPPLRLGGAEIGNWQAQGKGHPLRSLNGRIDEFVILERALSAEEIRELHEAGR